MSHPLTDALPDYLDALALRQACGEIEKRLTRERDEARAARWRAMETGVNAVREAEALRAEATAQKERAEYHGQRHRDLVIENSALRAEVERLRGALEQLAAAADAVGVSYFDTDDLPPGVVQMQSATIDARRVLQEPTP